MPVREIDGRTVAWREAGQGAPALLLHCGLAHSGAFTPLMARLGDRWEMRAIDQPGHGRSGYDPGRGLQAQAAADARAFFPPAAPVHLLGHSFGATVALRLAADAPARVASLTLIEPVQYSLVEATGAPAFMVEAEDEATMRAAVAAGDWRRATELFLIRWGAEGGLAGMSPLQAEYAVERMPLVVAADRDLCGPAASLHVADLAAITCPVLLLAGARSPRVIAEILAVLEAALPQARRVTVPGAGHMLPVTHPDAVSAAVRDFLALQHA